MGEMNEQNMMAKRARRWVGMVSVLALTSGGVLALSSGAAHAATDITCVTGGGHSPNVSVAVKKAAFTTPPKPGKKATFKIAGVLRGCTGDDPFNPGPRGIVGGTLKATFKGANTCAFLNGLRPYSGKVRVKWTNSVGKKVGKTSLGGAFYVGVLDIFSTPAVSYVRFQSSPIPLNGQSVTIQNPYPGYLQARCNQPQGLTGWSGEPGVGLDLTS
jgi:hypothetical protein